MAAPAGYFSLRSVAVEQAPIASHRAFPPALPRLVIGLEQIDAKIFPSGPIENLGNKACLIDAGRQERPRASARYSASPFRRSGSPCRERPPPPASGCRSTCAAASSARRRNVLPIGQEMNGDEIDIGADFPVAQPEFPDVGVGHGNIHARLDRADDFPQVGHDHLAAQQHFAADDDRRHRAGMVLDQRDGGVDERARSWRDRVRSRPRAEPSVRPWTPVRAPDPVRCRWNRCGCIW